MHNDVSGTIYSESKTEPDNNHVCHPYFTLHIFFSLKPKEAKLNPYSITDFIKLEGWLSKKLCVGLYIQTINILQKWVSRFEENIIMWTSCAEGIKATFWEYHLTFNFIP